MKKKCCKCGLEKDIREFYEHPLSRDGYSSMCKECQKEYSAKYVEKNKEKIKEYQRERYLKRKQEIAELKRLVEENGLSKDNN